MDCPRCHERIPSLSCPECGGEVPEAGRYCCWCGKLMPSTEKGPVEFSERVVCSDGSCIGTINERGVCNVCGKPYAGELA
jgi:hypothetical protein